MVGARGRAVWRTAMCRLPAGGNAPDARGEWIQRAGEERAGQRLGAGGARGGVRARRSRSRRPARPVVWRPASPSPRARERWRERRARGGGGPGRWTRRGVAEASSTDAPVIRGSMPARALCGHRIMTQQLIRRDGAAARTGWRGLGAWAVWIIAVSAPFLRRYQASCQTSCWTSGAAARAAAARAATKHGAAVRPPVCGCLAAAARASCCNSPVRCRPSEAAHCRTPPSCCSRSCCGHGFRLLVGIPGSSFTTPQVARIVCYLIVNISLQLAISQESV